MMLYEGQPFQSVNLMVIVTSHSSCVFLSMLVFKC